MTRRGHIGIIEVDGQRGRRLIGEPRSVSVYTYPIRSTPLFPANDFHFLSTNEARKQMYLYLLKFGWPEDV